MDPEDGLIWVFGVGDDGIMAFTDFGIENLTELIRIHKENPELLKKSGDPPSTISETPLGERHDSRKATIVFGVSF
jgi:hypothetical protein